MSQLSAVPASPCELSVVIKALNEERNIERTLRSVLAAVRGLDAEVVLADSLSTDRTVEIARRFPVVVVQLQHAYERCCGIGAQLGYQHARGRYVLVLDGDMEVERDWLLAALERLRSAPTLAGVGGVVDDVNLDNIEFRARQQRKPPDMMPGAVDRLNMGGLYRRSAIEQVGYLTHRGLHACEELELGLRLTEAGWGMERIDSTSIHHYGHTVPMWTLVRKRWRSHYADGLGELLRASIGQPWFGRALRCCRLPLAVLGWWGMLLLLALAAVAGAAPWTAVLAVLAFPPLVMVLKKRSLPMGLYSILAWTVDTAGLLRGLVRRPEDPRTAVASRIVHTPSEALDELAGCQAGRA